MADFIIKYTEIVTIERHMQAIVEVKENLVESFQEAIKEKIAIEDTDHIVVKTIQAGLEDYSVNFPIIIRSFPINDPTVTEVQVISLVPKQDDQQNP